MTSTTCSRSFSAVSTRCVGGSKAATAQQRLRSCQSGHDPWVRQAVAGHIRIYSEVGKGTTVKIYLPRMHAAEDVPAAPASLPSISESPARRAKDGETVLLVEDNEDVRSYALAILEELGYRVLEAGDAPAALDLPMLCFRRA